MKEIVGINSIDLAQIILNSTQEGFESLAKFNPSSISDLDNELEVEEDDSE
jgi:hypothetical protein